MRTDGCPYPEWLSPEEWAAIEADAGHHAEGLAHRAAREAVRALIPEEPP